MTFRMSINKRQEEMNRMIGIFDSGVGGMTVTRAIEKLLPSYPTVYFGDLARTPYGSKSAEAIIEYSIQNTEFLLNQGAELIVIACNSASSVAADILRERFQVPIFEVISPAITKAIASTKNNRIGVIGTRATIRSDIYNRKIKQLAPEVKVYSQPCPLLVPLVEEGWLNGRETKMILRRYLHPMKAHQIDVLVLGCTHYPIIKELIHSRIGKKNVSLVDSSEEVAHALKFFLEDNRETAEKLVKTEGSRYYVSDKTEAATATARMIFGRDINLIKTDH